jgi:hypothetical protein
VVQLKRFVLFLCFFCFLLPLEVPAEDNLEISITYGIDGKVQMGKGFPITVKVTNHGDTISGDLVFFSSPTYETAGNIVVPVEFPGGEDSTFTVSIPGYNDNYYYSGQNNRSSFVKFYENGWEDGTEKTLKGNVTKRPAFFPENRIVIGTLTETADSLNGIKGARYNGESVEFLNLTKEDIASEAIGLEVFDVLIINDFQLSNLTDQQVTAIKEWTAAGGHLMLGSDPFNQQHEGFGEIFLLDIQGQTSFSELNFFVPHNDEEENLPNFENVEIHTGLLDDYVSVIYSHNSIPIVFNKNHGMGEISQFAFNLGSETLTEWNGYTSWWSDVLQQTVDKDIGGQRYTQDELSYRLGKIAETYPSSFIPVKILVVLFIVYLIVIIPGLYFVLKKLDKREISWIIIPAVAIISSIAIFLVGAKDRIGGLQINNVSILAIDENGVANGYGAFSILSNNGGNYPITIKTEGFEAFPIERHNYYEESSIDSFAMVEKGQQLSKITFTDVEYWSIRSAMGQIHSLDTGKLEAELWVENNQLNGSVSSSLSFDLNEAYLLSGSKSYPIGEIKAGETVNVEIALDTKNVQNLIGAPNSNIASSIYSGYYSQNYYGGLAEPKDRESLMEWKKFGLLDSIMYFDIQPKDLKQPVIAGFTTDLVTEIELDKKTEEHNLLSVVTQGVDVEIRSLKGGEFKLGRDITPEISIVSGNSGLIHHNGLMYGENFVAVEQGKYQLTYQIPVQMDLDNISVNKLRIRHPMSSGTVFSIFNVKTNEFIPLEGGQTTFEENVEDLIAEDGRVIITFEKEGMNNPDVNIPTIELEGEFTQ